MARRPRATTARSCSERPASTRRKVQDDASHRCLRSFLPRAGQHPRVTSSTRAGARPGPNRVPEPDTAFWAVKVLTTGMGETISDSLVRTFAPEVVVPVALLV